VKEHPIIFSGDMVKAIREGRKTQTRRVVMPATSIVGVGRVDWSRFCWDGSETFDFGDARYSTESEYVPDELKGQLIGVQNAPLPWVDHSCGDHYQYLHVPYRYADNATIFRIYPKWDVGDRLWVRETFYDDCGLREREGFKVDDYLHYRADGEVWEQFECPCKPFRWTPSIHMPRWASRIDREITGIRAERLQDISEEDAKAEGVHALYKTAPHTFGAGYIQDGKGYRRGFQALWDTINAKRGYPFDDNPWVWVIEFAPLD